MPQFDLFFGAGRRLPTEAEWEYAARGPTTRRYPWPQNLAMSQNRLNNASGDDPFQFTAPVGSFPNGRSWVDADDLAGNVWEWVADYYSPAYYSRSPDSNPAGPASGSVRVIRGGAWNSSPGETRVSNRGFVEPDTLADNVGFRCATELSS